MLAKYPPHIPAVMWNEVEVNRAVSPASLALPWLKRTKMYVDKDRSGARTIGKYSIIMLGEIPADATRYNGISSSGLEPSRPSTNEY